MNNEERAMKASTPLSPDYRIVRGGMPGKYFFYRPAEVLVLDADEKAVAEVLGEGRGNDGIAASDRTEQRQAIRSALSEPFGVMLFRFDVSAKGRARSVEDAIELLRAKQIVAGYNYISSRSPMRSHAVSYAEPSEPNRLESLTRRSTSKGWAKRPMTVGVLDTGRPVYDEAFRSYYRNRFPIAPVASGGPDGASASSGSALHDPFDQIDAIFVDRPVSRASRKAGSGSVRPPDADRDTMVTSGGRLSHPHAGHGVFVSSILARHAPDVRVLAEATMYRDAIADLHEILVDLADATARPHNCKLLNMSLGFPTEDDKCPKILERALSLLGRKKVLLVASAGNDGGDRPMWPAAHPDVVAVAATDAEGTPTDWSNHGEWVDVCAVGNDVDSNYVLADWDFPDGTSKRFRGAARWSGTSFAAPLVTACIANEMLEGGGTAREAWGRLRLTGERKDEHGDDIPAVYGVRVVPRSK